MTYLVHGATGAQGSPVVSALKAAGRHPVAAVRTPAHAPEDVDATAVDLGDASSLTDAYRGAAGVFVHLPMGAPEQSMAYAEAVAAAVAAARPDRVVISTSGQVLDQPGSPLQASPDSPIATLIRKVTQTGISTAVVAPRLYSENLLLPVVAGPARHDGVLRYPLPERFPISWSSHLDVADVVVRLLTDTSVTGTVAVGQLPGLTGPDLAAGFADHLRRPVRYEPIEPDVFGELITPLFGARTSASVVGLYQMLNAQAGNVIDKANSAQRLLGLTPRSVARWLDEVGFGG
ncbi:SDR family oxidoreductase [Nocardioides hungaricus]